MSDLKSRKEQKLLTKKYHVLEDVAREFFIDELYPADENDEQYKISYTAEYEYLLDDGFNDDIDECRETLQTIDFKLGEFKTVFNTLKKSTTEKLRIVTKLISDTQVYYYFIFDLRKIDLSPYSDDEEDD